MLNLEIADVAPAALLPAESSMHKAEMNPDYSYSVLRHGSGEGPVVADSLSASGAA